MRTKLMNEIKNKGFVKLDNGELFYKANLVNKVSFPDMSDKLIQQLKEEGLYDSSFIGYITSDINKGSMEMLPIYETKTKDKYETKWFKSTVDEVIKADLKDKNMGLLKRYVAK